MDPFNPTHLTRFQRAHEWSRKQLAPFRRNRSAIYQFLAGPRYGEGMPYSQPLPYLKLLHQVYVRSLIGNSPRAMISTMVSRLKPAARAMEVAVSHQCREIKLEEAVASVVSDALVSMGIAKVGMCYDPKEGTQGLLHDYGLAYVDPISLDDWNMDMRAHRPDQWGYAGHRFRAVKESLLQDPRVKDPDKLRLLPVSERIIYDEWGVRRVETLSSGEELNDDGDHEDMLDLWEYWFPRDGLVVVFGASRDGRLLPEPLYVQDYEGPELGPYHLLRFGELPDNIMPAPPLPDMADLNESMNAIYRKLIRQALRQKSILPVPGGSDPDVTRINQTADGHAVRVDGILPQEVNYGNLSQANQMFGNELRQLGSYYAGNLEALAGLGPQSETVGQDELISQASSKQVQAMQQRTVDFTRGVMESLCWYWWTDPHRDYNVEVPVAGHPEVTVNEEIKAADREGTWLELNFQVDPYSFQGDSPQKKLQMMNAVMDRIMQALPVLMQQGLAPNWLGYLKEAARLGNWDWLENLLISQEPLSDAEEMTEAPQFGKPANTKRTYERVSRPGASFQGKQHAMQMALMGAAQPKELAGMGRPVG